MPAKPMAIIAQVEGSGTDGVTGVTVTLPITPSAGDPSELAGV